MMLSAHTMHPVIFSDSITVLKAGWKVAFKALNYRAAGFIKPFADPFFHHRFYQSALSAHLSSFAIDDNRHVR